MINNLINPLQRCYDLFFSGTVVIFTHWPLWWLSCLGSRFMFVLRSVSNLPMVYKRLFTLQCFRPCVLCWVYCGQWSALVSCWQAFGHSLWACCPSTPYHRSIDLLLQVPASVSISAFFVSLPVSLPPCLFSSICSSVRLSVFFFAFAFVFLLLSSAVFTLSASVSLPVYLSTWQSFYSFPYFLSESDFLSVNLCSYHHAHPFLSMGLSLH